MKMKKFATKFSAVALIALALTSCKKTPNTPPEQDKEFQSSVDASAATSIAFDIDMMMAQASEKPYMEFYSHPSTTVGSNTVTIYRDTTNKMNYLYFNNARCFDGVVRNGTVVINYTECSTGTITGAGQVYVRNPNHKSVIRFINFSVGKYRVKSSASPNDSSIITVKNTTPAGYTRSITPLSWSISGKLYLADTTDAGGSKALDISWDGQFTKVLTNSTSNTIHPGTTLPIKWITGLPGIPTGTVQTSSNNALNPSGKNGIVKYTGSAKGTTAAGSYEYKVEETNPLYRDFGCSPDYYIAPEQHPINRGKVTFKIGDKAVRTIYYGDQQDNPYCDNSGIVYINGLSYNVDFVK
jgi:hypothetical protein